MISTIAHSSGNIVIDLSKPIDISLPLKNGIDNVNAWNAEAVRFEPVRIGNWVGDVNQGAAVNYRNVFFNPHGNGTHTECVGHISKEYITINQCLREYFFLTELITINPELKANGDRVLSLKQIRERVSSGCPEALIIRNLPNEDSKRTQIYSSMNPPYLEQQAADHIRKMGVKHLLIDLPSVDREQDDGKLLAHRAFWNYPENTRMHATITELVFVPNQIPDGNYFMNIQIASLENDASPSKVLLFHIL